MLAALAARLDRRRWRPSVICLERAGPLAEVLRGDRVEIECLGVNPRRPLPALALLAGALRRQSPRLVQSFLFHANVAARLAAPLAGTPWVLGGLRIAEHQKRWHRDTGPALDAAGGGLGLRLARGGSGSAARSWACTPSG